MDCYPIPKADDLFATLAKRKVFSKINLSHTYQQLPLTEESNKFVIINTRLPFCIFFGFQRVMKNILQGIPKVVVYLDGILVAGDSKEEYFRLLCEVLDKG